MEDFDSGFEGLLPYSSSNQAYNFLTSIPLYHKMKQTYNLAPATLIGLEIFLGSLTISIGALRFWILRHRRKTTAELISDMLFLFSLCVNTANITLVCYKLFDEIEIRKKYQGLMAELLLFAPKYLKVLTHPSSFHYGLTDRATDDVE